MRTGAPARSHPARTAAFTLVELVIVLAIVGTVAAIAIPRFTGFADRQRADAAAERIRSDLVLAKSDARALSQDRVISFDAATESYEIIGRSGENRATDAYAVNLLAEPYRSVIVAADFGGKPSVTFDAYGHLSDAGAVTIQSGSVRRRVTIGGVEVKVDAE